MPGGPRKRQKVGLPLCSFRKKVPGSIFNSGGKRKLPRVLGEKFYLLVCFGLVTAAFPLLKPLLCVAKDSIVPPKKSLKLG